MKSINYFYDMVKISNISLLGYTFKDESVKDEIISKIPHMEIGEVDSSFSFKKYLRDQKLNYLFGDINQDDVIRSFVLDINNICPKYLVDKNKLISETIDSIRESLYSCQISYNLIITCPIFRANSNYDINSFVGGSSPIYTSDFACVLVGNNELKIVKNRHEFDHVETVTDNRKISLDNLKDYTYICDYENCQ